ncbi:hypothetical protein BSL78_02022 [Apostichopus japonicus]|uniref:Dynamin-like GTPase OPA1 C-terminal domain-containing protein n=1 Tax=Stichopus japonicus TaxID=307972 RepID=A0A2G8LLA0_STIJA|nr:hypothetical protein BSL78_02022 [Apostichopus japonicus]
MTANNGMKLLVSWKRLFTRGLRKVNRRQTQEELEKLLQSEVKHQPQLSADEITTVKKNLQTKGVDVENNFIQQTWHPLYRKRFLLSSLSLANECRRGFYHYQRDLNDDSGFFKELGLTMKLAHSDNKDGHLLGDKRWKVPCCVLPLFKDEGLK